MRRVVVLLALAGCYGPTPQVGLPCSPEDRCPDGQECRGGTCQLPGGLADAHIWDAEGEVDGGECDLAALPPTIPAEGLPSEDTESGEQVEKTATVNDDDTVVTTVYKQFAPWGDSPVADTEYKIDLSGACGSSSAACVKIEAIPPGESAVQRTYEVVDGQLTVVIVNTPPTFTDPNDCASSDGDMAGCEGRANCDYKACNARCVPTGTLECAAGCLKTCGILFDVEDATLVDTSNAACSTYVVHLSL